MFAARVLIAVFAVALGNLSVEAAQGGKAAKPAAVVCTQIKTAAQLQKMNDNLAGIYCLAKDIDLSSIDNFVPIGNSGTPFTGRFYGNNHVISKLNIKTSGDVGLFGAISNSTIQDVALVDAKVVGQTGSNVGGLVAFVANAGNTITNASITGQVKCATSANCGGMVGFVAAGLSIAQSWSAAKVTAADSSNTGGLIGFQVGPVDQCYATGSVTVGQSANVGGLIGFHNAGGNVTKSYATGPVQSGDNVNMGGLIGFINSSSVLQSYAVGAVTAGANANVGGLSGFLNGGIVQQSFAAGAAKGGASATTVGGLLGTQGGGTTDQSYSIGKVTGGTGAMIGGLIGDLGGGTVTSSYWDKDTSKLTTSGGGSGLTTDQLQARLRAGFVSPWAITKGHSFPFLNDPDIALAAPLSTMARNARVLIFLPISQLDKSNYGGSTKHLDQASLATTYTILARAIGIGFNEGSLEDVRTSKYFWNDNSQTTTFKGPITDHATLGTLKNISGAIGSEVTHQLDSGSPVILRGSFQQSGGGTGTHYMLATLYTKVGSKVQAIVAHDPWTGVQVEIDPSSKTVILPANFPLAGFKVNGFQPVAIH